jgi:Ribonuclease G/E
MDQTEPLILRSLIDEAIGERRQIMIAPDGRALSLRLHRWSWDGRKARWGETYAARVRTLDKSRRGAHLDLGLKDEMGFLPLNQSGGVRLGDNAVSLQEGALAFVEVRREAARGKQPVLRLLSAAAPEGFSTPGRVDTRDKPFERNARSDEGAREAADAALEAVLSRRAPIPGGGMLSIEPTSAMVAIDVDSEGRKGSGDPERFARELNLAAALEIVRQIRLRALGGLVAVDFVSMRQEESRKAVSAAFKIALNTLPWQVQIAPMSRFGVIECAIEQLLTPLHEILLGPDGRISAQTAALDLLRAIEREAAAYGGRRILARAPQSVLDWLNAGLPQWRDSLQSRIGPRFEVQAADLSPGKFDAHAL